MLEWELSETFPVRTRKQLINLFYKEHTFKDWDGDEWVKVACHPISLVMNPVPFVMPDDPFAQDMYLAIYGQAPKLPGTRYYITIEENINHPFSGPHAVKLNIQIYPGSTGKKEGKFAWLASMQMKCNFHSLKKIHAKLRRAIRLREFFATDASLEEEIVFDRDHVARAEF